MVMIAFLFVQQILLYQWIPQHLRNYFSSLPFLYPRKKVCLNKKLTYRRGYFNFYQTETGIYDEVKMMYKLIENIKNRK
jgi:stage IV sporulation protein FB